MASILNLKFIGILFLIFSNLVSSVSSQNKRSIISEQLPIWLNQSHTPSASVAYIESGNINWVIVSGERAPGEKAKLDTLYNISSLTKPITAEIAIRLIDQGKISINEKVTAVFFDKDLEQRDWSSELSINHLLSHQSGFPNWRNSANDKLSFSFKPGSRAGYSGEGYQYLANFLQKKFNRNFEQLAQSLVFEPIGMTQTAYTSKSWFGDRVALPKGPEMTYGLPTKRTKFNAADDVHTTIEDYAKFVSSVMQGKALKSAIKSSRWLTEHNLVKFVCQSGRLEERHCPESMGFALGWSRFDYLGETIYMHGGGDWGERSIAVIFPDRKQAVVVLTNGANGMKVIRNVIAEIFSHASLTAFLSMQAGD